MSATLLVLALLGADSEAAEAELAPGSPQAVEAAIKLTSETVQAAKDKSYVKAIATAEEAARLAPGAPAPRQLLGDLYLRLGDCARAMHWFSDVERMAREDKAVKRARKVVKMCATDKKRQGEVVIRVEPAEASVNLFAPGAEAAVAAGQGRAEGTVPAGTYRLVAKLPGFTDLEADVQVPAKGKAEVAHRLERLPSVLVVKTEPPGAQVELDGKARGAAPLTIQPVKPGDHEVVAKLDRYRPARARVAVEAGRRVELELRPEPQPAKLSVTAADADGEPVEGAQVEVAGATKGKAPLEIELPAGQKGQVRVVAPGYLPAVKELEPPPGQVGDLAFSLEQSPEEATRAAKQRWGAILAGSGGLVAAAGVVVLFAGMNAATDADAAYGRYEPALTGDAAAAAYAEAASLDEQAAGRQTLGLSLLGGGVVLAVVGGWQILSAP